MKNILKYVFFTSFIVLGVNTAIAQDYSADAKVFFAKYLSTRSYFDLCKKSLPDLKDCKMVLKAEHAYTMFGAMGDIKNGLDSEMVNRNNEVFEDVKIEVFSTQDIELGKGNYAGGMKEVFEKLQPYVLFYKVTYLRKKGDDAGLAYKYWAYIHGRWVFFPAIHRFR